MNGDFCSGISERIVGLYELETFVGILLARFVIEQRWFEDSQDGRVVQDWSIGGRHDFLLNDFSLDNDGI